jgi:cellulose synthase/poly-beta-1,6-N-acetylglucosamine synthase-like glycosyltransferase
MSPLSILFWAGAFFVVYTYVGYGLLSALVAKLKSRRAETPPSAGATGSDPFEPAVTLLVAAYNERDIMEEKVQNSLDLDYPSDKLRILFVTDGSTDGSPEFLQSRTDVDVLHEDKRRGKIGAINRAMPLVESPIVVFTDANTMLNSGAIRAVVKHYADPAVGGVSGEKRIQSTGSASSDGEGFYWRYESALKQLDSRNGSVVGAAGELFSIRTELFQPVEADAILDDFMISLRVVEQGYVVRYEPGANALEHASANIGEELKRKVRICAGGFQSIFRLPALLNPFRFGIVTWQYVSHRVLRWTLAPASLLILLVTSMALAQGSVFYAFVASLQITFYLLALGGWLARHRATSNKWLLIPFYFTFMNLASFAGLYRYVTGRQSVLWEKAARG